MLDEKETRDMLLTVICSLVDHPADVKIDTVLDEGGTAFRVHSHPSDTGKLIGKAGKTARALRVILGAKAAQLGQSYSLDIVSGTERWDRGAEVQSS